MSVVTSAPGKDSDDVTVQAAHQAPSKRIAHYCGTIFDFTSMCISTVYVLFSNIILLCLLACSFVAFL